ncbi:response regulator [bacterium]|nr:response regulator [bacterium]
MSDATTGTAGGLPPVIMVDDSSIDAVVARQCHKLSELPHEFIVFESGTRFLAHLEEIGAGSAPMPLVVLLDINMPGMNGFEVLETVRSREAFLEIPVIVMLTNSDRSQDIERATQLGADGFKTKPNVLADYIAFFRSLPSVSPRISTS